MIDDVDQRLLESREPSAVADVVAEVLSPPIVVVALLTAISFHASSGLPSALGWIALTTTFCAGIPYLLLLRSVRAGHVADRHLVRRDERRRPLLAALLSVLAGLTLLVWLDAPSSLTALVVAFVAGLVVMLPITLQWKASLHVAVVSGALAIIGRVFGPVLAVTLSPALLLTAWARIRAGRHTLPQVVVGSSVGSAVAISVFDLVR